MPFDHAGNCPPIDLSHELERIRKNITSASDAYILAKQQGGILCTVAYVNIKVSPAYSKLSDPKLLEKLKEDTGKESTSIDVVPEDNWNSQCISIEVECPYPVDGMLDNSLIQRCLYLAEEKILEWMRDYKRDGLPFNRQTIFKSGFQG